MSRFARRIAGVWKVWTPAILWAQAATQPRPVGTGYVRYEDIYQTGDTFQQTCNRVPADGQGNPQILTLPTGTFQISDFTNGYYDGVRLGQGGAVNCGGIVGSGRNTIIQLVANSASRDKGGSIAGNIIQIASVPNAVMSNFQLQGSSQVLSGTTLSYSGIIVNNCLNAEVSWLYLRGASPVYANYPPGETFGISIYRSDSTVIRDTEVDGRDLNGTRQGASPIGWNGSGSYPNITFAQNARIYRTYCHHGRTGMPTFWETQNIYTEDLWSFSTASGTGDQSGCAINHEQVKGPITHVRPYLFVHNQQSAGTPPPYPLPDDARTNNNNFAFSLNSTIEDVGPTTKIVEPVWDKAYSGSGLIIMRASDSYDGGTSGQSNALVTPPTIIKNGVSLQHFDHPNSGWNTKDPTLYYAWVH